MSDSARQSNVSASAPRLALLIELRGDRPGALAAALRPFARHGVSLTHIESRPCRGPTFDFYVDCEGVRGAPAIEAAIAELHEVAEDVVPLHGKDVAWFPRHIAELDRIANNTAEGGAVEVLAEVAERVVEKGADPTEQHASASVQLAADHPGFADPQYRRRRGALSRIARNCRHGNDYPRVDYTAAEHETWRNVYQQLAALHPRYACAEYRRALAALEKECGYAEGIPQGRDVSAFLTARTGFRLRPVAGLLSSRDFLNGLAFRVFFATLYIRHRSRPFYTPEPDVCHELIGHAPMFADAAFADLSQEIGLASLGADDYDIERLARCYWHSVEFGLVRERGALKAYGAGLLSSFGELDHACGGRSAAEFRPWRPDVAATQPYPICEYQPQYFVADSLQDAKTRMRDFCRSLPRPFYARYNPATECIWVDRAVRRVADDPTITIEQQPREHP